MLMGTMFDTAFQRFAAAFEKRADADLRQAARSAHGRQDRSVSRSTAAAAAAA